jgi:hypothetical protein
MNLTIIRASSAARLMKVRVKEVLSIGFIAFHSPTWGEEGTRRLIAHTGYSGCSKSSVCKDVSMT